MRVVWISLMIRSARAWLIPLLVGIACRRFPGNGWLLSKHPTREPDCSERDRSPLRPSSSAGIAGSRVDQFSVDLGGFCRRCRLLSRHALRPWNPSADVRERFRAADRTALLIVNLLTVEAETRNAKVHELMINPQTNLNTWVRSEVAVHSSTTNVIKSVLVSDTRPKLWSSRLTGRICTYTNATQRDSALRQRNCVNESNRSKFCLGKNMKYGTV
jgi:hypothetical protein